MWEACCDHVEAHGVPVQLGHRCVAISIRTAVESVVIQTNGHETEHRVDGVLSSIPLSELVLALDPLRSGRGAGGSAPSCGTAISSWSR